MFLVMHVPSWYTSWRERRRTARIANGLPGLPLPSSVNASVTVMGGSEVASTITKYGRTPLGGTPSFATPNLSRVASRDSHAQPQVPPSSSQIFLTPPIMSASEPLNANVPSIAVTRS
jgi:hypothetical protein